MDNPRTEKEKTMPLITVAPLTATELQHEISSLKELLLTRISAVEDGIKIAHDDFTRFPTEVDKTVGALRELLECRIDCSDDLKEEKFKNIDKRLDLVEQARIEQKKDTATAVDAALKAAKEAVTEQNTSNVLAINKSETATTKQIDQQAVLLTQIRNSLDEKINDVKAEVSVIKQNLSGTKGKGEGYEKLIYLLIAAAGVLWAIFGK